MSILLVGASHRSASVPLLESLAVDSEAASKLAARALDTVHVTEALVLTTCNRVELYAEVDRFHGAVEDLSGLLVAESGLPPDAVLPSVYVHYDEAVVAHVFAVATGLDSMVVGESQILGQVRKTLSRGQRDDTVGPTLNSLFQQGLRVAKRVHTETGIDRAGQSLVSVAVDAAIDILGSLAGARICIVGAGSMAALAAASVRRGDAADIVVVSRTLERAHRLAAGVGGRAAALDDLLHVLGDADLVISCTGASGTVIGPAHVRRALTDRPRNAELVLIDLALPHDIDPSVADLPGVTVLGLAALAARTSDELSSGDVDAAAAIVAEEVAAFAAARAAARAAPTVVALRTMATGVVAGELSRLWARLDDLSPEHRREIATTVGRVADKLLHEPTVRIKQLADQTPSASYADALAELFALDPATVHAVTEAVERP